jgi:hypothetical protein
MARHRLRTRDQRVSHLSAYQYLLLLVTAMRATSFTEHFCNPDQTGSADTILGH